MQTNARMFQAAVRISEPHERLDILLFIDTVGNARGNLTVSKSCVRIRQCYFEYFTATITKPPITARTRSIANT
jgi:hypothetical protein